MISTSEEWKELYHNDDLFPESDVNVVCDDAVITANVFEHSAEYALSNADSVNHAKEKMNREEKRVATYELNEWILDDTYIINKYNQPLNEVNRFISSGISDQNCEMNPPPYLTLSGFISDIYYVTVKFSPETYSYATKVRFTLTSVYDVEYTEEFEINEFPENYVVFRFKKLYDQENSIKKIKMEILKTNVPYSRARVDEFLVGARIFYDKKNISSFSHTKSTSMVCASLPQNNCSVNVLDINYDLDFSTNSAKYSYIMNKLKNWKIYYGYKLNNGWEYILGDTLITDTINHPGNSIEATIELKGDISNWTQTFRSDLGLTDEHWLTLHGCINIIAQKTGAIIKINTGNYLDAQAILLCRRLQGFYASGNARDEQYMIKSDYYTMPMNEWFQQICALINNSIKREADGTYSLKFLVDSTGTRRTQKSVDDIKKEIQFEFPTTERLDLISSVEFKYLKEDSRQLEDSEVTVSDSASGETIYHTYPKIRFITNYPYGVNQETNQSILFIDKDRSVPGFTMAYFTEADKFHERYANFIHSFLSGAKEITANCMINPAWEPTDVLNLYDRSIDVYDTGIRTGFVEEINITYEGALKGTVKLLCPQD